MPPPAAQTSLRARFYRRPLFWLALGAVLGLHAAWTWQWPVWLAVLAALGGALGFAAGQREAGVTLVFAGLFAALGAAERGPQQAPWAATVRGHVLRAFGERLALFQVEERLTRDGWVPDRRRLGVVLPAVPGPGRRLELSGLVSQPTRARNPGGFDARLDWLRRGAGEVLRPRPGGFRDLGPGPQHPARLWARAVREAATARNHATLSPPAALIANAFLLGDTRAPDPGVAGDVEAAFRESGTIHLLVVSGAQVSLVLAGFVWLGWRLWRARVLFWGLGVAAVGVFWLLTDGDASVSRAAVVGAVFVLGLCLAREPDGENCLGAAALVLLAANRWAAFDIGAQLSFAAVWGLIRLTGPLTDALGGPAREDGLSLRRGAAGALAACVAAHLTTAPVLAYHFQAATWSGVPANLPMVGLGTVLMPTAALHALGLPGFGVVADYLAAALLGWARFFAQPGLGAVAVFPFPGGLAAPYFFLLAAAAAPAVGRAGAVLVCLAAGAVLVLSAHLPAPAPRAPLLHALDVGQGDALLLRDGAGSTVLVDAGPPEAGADIVRACRALRIGALDAAVVSHADSDHIGGLPRVLAEMRVGALIHRVDPEPEEAIAWRRVLTAAARRGVPVATPEAGEALVLRGSTLTFLGPIGPATEWRGNEGSLVARWDAGGLRCLLTGDAGAEAEATLMAWGGELRADVLKLGHHGSAGSSTPPFLRAVAPRVAVISCGRDNRYRHPARAVLDRLRDLRIPAERTDRSGMLTLRRGRAGVTVERCLAGP